MHFPLSWRWPQWWWVCYAWCTSRIPFGTALRFSVSRGGARLVRLASSTRDCFGSPRLEIGSLLPRLGFHPKSEGYSVGDLSKLLPLGSPQSRPAFAPPVHCLWPFVALGLGHPWRLFSTLRGPWLGLASNTWGLLPFPAALHDRCIGTIVCTG
ncbi:hypothetical protein V6N13_007825 [Hibiscus sabdariffa]